MFAARWLQLSTALLVISLVGGLVLMLNLLLESQRELNGIRKKWSALNDGASIRRISEETLFETSKYLYIKSYRHPDSLFDRNSIFSLPIVGWRDVSRSVQKAYELRKNQLKTLWRIDDPELERAVFMMNAVAYTLPRGEKGWAHGGGVFSNSTGKIPYDKACAWDRTNLAQRARPADYVKAIVADCNDHAMMLYMLLNLAGVSAMQVGSADHVYVQATIGGKIYILDAFNNLLAQADDQTYRNQPLDRPFNIYLFPLPAANASSALHFRSGAETERIQHILSYGRLVPKQKQDFSLWNQYQKWELAGYVPDPDCALAALKTNGYSK